MGRCKSGLGALGSPVGTCDLLDGDLVVPASSTCGTASRIAVPAPGQLFRPEPTGKTDEVQPTALSRAWERGPVKGAGGLTELTHRSKLSMIEGHRPLTI